MILQDTDIDDRAWSWWRDAGIAAQTIMLGAAEKGLGGLMIGSFDREPLREVTKLADNLKILLVLAIGKPLETSVLEDLEEGEALIVRDENNVTHVRKRKVVELIVKRK